MLPCAAELVMGDGDPILVFCYESDIWIGHFSLAHLVGPVVYLDPPFAAVRSAQVPLITSVHTFCLCRLKTAAHGIEHILRRRIGRLIRTREGGAHVDQGRQSSNSREK